MQQIEIDVEKMKPIEVTFYRTLEKLRRARSRLRNDTSLDARKIEEDIAYKIQHIESYGFRFFPNHYLYDDVWELKTMVNNFESAGQSV